LRAADRSRILGSTEPTSATTTAGASGNGPYDVRGPIRVVGRDHYRLDADHDGIACE